MSTSLTEDQVAQYWRDGFMFPLRIMSEDAALSLRAELEAIETRYADGGLPHPIAQYKRVNSHCVMPLAARVAMENAILDAVEGILGPDLLIWSCEFFIKEANTDKIVSWHQDLTYWGLGETSDQVTAWLALSPVTEESGCMRFVAGTHKSSIVEHRDTFAEDNLLSRGQEIAVEVDEADATSIVLKPGEMSLHHGQLFHASGPNTSNDRRIGVAIRYVNPNAEQHVAKRDYAMLARGVDRKGNFVHFAPPPKDFDPASLALYDEIREAQAVALAQGADQAVGMYAAMNARSG